MEELTAEFTASYICGITNLLEQTIQNNAAYIKSWIRTFKNDPKVLVCAAAQAQKAVNYILNNRVSEKTYPEEEELILEPLEF